MSSRIIDALVGKRAVNGFENPTEPISGSKILKLFGFDDGNEPVSVNEATALRMTAVYRAVALLSGLVGSLPLHAYDRTDTGRIRAEDDLVDAPHGDATPMELREYIGTSLFTHGNFYARKQRDRAGFIRELEPFHPSEVTVEQNDAWRSATNPAGKRFNVAGRKFYTPLDLLHIPGLSYDGLVGLSPIQMAKQGIGLAIAAQKFGAKMFSRGGLIPGVLETDKDLKKEAAEALQDRWEERTSGQNNWWRVPVLDKGATYKAIALPPKDAMYLEAQEWGVTEIARLYGIPPHLLADVERSTSWGTGIEQQNMQMLTFTLDPWLVRIEQRITQVMRQNGLPRRYAKFNRAALLRADTASRYLAYQRGWQSSFLNADDIREAEDMPPLPDGLGQIFHRPKNIEPIQATGGDTDA